MVQSLKCSSLHTRKITLPNCNEYDPQDCTRVYHIILPRILCHSGVRRLGEASPEENEEYFEGTHKRVGTLPLVFALHAFKEDARSMEVFIPYADASHFVLVLPEGKDFSFNAGDCCGAAKHDDVNDVNFLAHLKQELTQEFSFLHPSLTYGIGWNNGAFMLTYASQQVPGIFRAIVAIAGYTHRLQEIAKADVGMMMHYSLDDTQTRPSGCCDNPNLPKCNGEVMSDWCVSILQFFDLWAREVDQCSIDDSIGGFDNHIVSNNDGVEYRFQYLDNSTVFELTPDTNNPEKVDKLFATKLPMSTTYHDEEKGVSCLTVTSPSCVSNSTLCLYTKQGDFGPTFATSFFMYDEVMNYIANDACEIDNGEMVSVPNSSKRVCACEITPDDEVEYGGTFCFDALNEDGTFKPSEIAPVAQPLSAVRHQTRSYVFVGMFVTMFTVIVLTIRRLKKRRVVVRKNSGRQIYDHCDQYSPKYRDFGRKDTDKVSNVKKKKHDDDPLMDDSEHNEHASPFRYRDQIDQIHDTASHHLDTSEWDEHQSPYLSNIIKATEMVEAKRQSEIERGDSFESLDDSYLEEHQPPWEVCPQEKMPVKERKKAKGAKGSKSSLPTSLMHVINSPSSYLDSADRRLLRRYRQQQKEDDVNRAIIGGVKNAIIRKNSEQGRGSPSTDTEGAAFRTSADASLAGDEASLSNDLEQIEASMGTMT